MSNQERLNQIKTITEILSHENNYFFCMDKVEINKLVTMREKLIASIDERLIF